MCPLEGKTSSQRSEPLRGGLHPWGSSSVSQPWTVILRNWKHALHLASWDFPERTQMNESSHTQTGLGSSLHCYFIQVILQSPEFEGNVSISSQVMMYPTGQPWS